MAGFDRRYAAAMNPPRQFLHVISRLDGYGGARMLRPLATHQAAAGHRVAVAALRVEKPIARELAAAGVAVDSLAARWRADPFAVRRLQQILRHQPPEVVHAWDLPALFYAAVAAARQAPPRLIGALHADQHESRWIAPAIQKAARPVDTFIVNDEQTKHRVADCGIPQSRIALIRPGVPAAPPSPATRETLLTHLSVPPDARLIAVAGPLERRKQVDEAVWHFELLRVLHENAVMLVLGDGPDYERLERFIELVSQPGSVRLLGYRPDIAAILPHVDVYWQLSPAAGAPPLALLEAQAAGAPIVANDLPAHRAAIADGHSGLLVPPGDRAELVRATDRLLSSPELANSLGREAAASAIRQWSLESAISSYSDLYGGF